MSTIPVRVMVEQAWDQVALELPASTTFAETKARALALTHVTEDPGDSLVKFRGAEVLDEQKSLGDLGVVPNAALIVLPRRRRPLR